MANYEDVLRIIAAAAGLETRNSPPEQDSSPSVENQTATSVPERNNTEEQPVNVLEESIAEEEQKALSSNLDETHEIMQKLRMNGMQTEIDKLKAEINGINVASHGSEIDNRLRERLADMTFHFMIGWCSFVGIVFLVYLGCSDGTPPVEAIIALLGTSTLSIVGLVGFVVSGLFKTPKEK